MAFDSKIKIPLGGAGGVGGEQHTILVDDGVSDELLATLPFGAVVEDKEGQDEAQAFYYVNKVTTVTPAAVGGANALSLIFEDVFKIIIPTGYNGSVYGYEINANPDNPVGSVETNAQDTQILRAWVWHEIVGLVSTLRFQFNLSGSHLATDNFRAIFGGATIGALTLTNHNASGTTIDLTSYFVDVRINNVDSGDFPGGLLSFGLQITKNGENLFRYADTPETSVETRVLDEFNATTVDGDDAPVISDATLSGDGTGSGALALRVSNPFTDTDEAKLDGIAAGATVGQTQQQVATAIETAVDAIDTSDVIVSGGFATEELVEANVNVTNSSQWVATGFTPPANERTGYWLMNFGALDTSEVTGNNANWHIIDVAKLYAIDAGTAGQTSSNDTRLVISDSVSFGSYDVYIGHDSSGQVLFTSNNSSSGDFYPLTIRKIISGQRNAPVVIYNENRIANQLSHRLITLTQELPETGGVALFRGYFLFRGWRFKC